MASSENIKNKGALFAPMERGFAVLIMKNGT